jgi:hypothetical protein
LFDHRCVQQSGLVAECSVWPFLGARRAVQIMIVGVTDVMRPLLVH